MSFGHLVRFLTNAYCDHTFKFDMTPEELLAKFDARPGADDHSHRFLTHATKTAFLNLTVVEVLAGKMKATRNEPGEFEFLRGKLFEQSFDERLALVIREAAWWDHRAALSQVEASCSTI